jgi:hypothetical protein
MAKTRYWIVDFSFHTGGSAEFLVEDHIRDSTGLGMVAQFLVNDEGKMDNIESFRTKEIDKQEFQAKLKAGGWSKFKEAPFPDADAWRREQ